MKDIYSTMLDCIRTETASVLATIINQTTAGPRGAGAKLLIMKDGALAGSIGGGLLEKAVIEAASGVFSSGVPVRFRSSPEMSCGGDVELFLEPVRPGDITFRMILDEIADAMRTGGSGFLATVMDPHLWQGDRSPRAFYKFSGGRTGELPGIEEKIIMDGIAGFPGKNIPDVIVCRDMAGNEVSILIEPVISGPVLYIFGAGHVSSQAAPLARRVGFKVIVIDDRPGFCDPANFPDADEICNLAYDDVMERFQVNGSSYIVIVTRGHSFDQMVLGQALRTDAGYIGMIGSRRKISTIYGRLLEEGFTRKDLDRVHSPIGIEIGAETPEEIALSIVAELVKVRRTKEKIEHES